MTFFSCSGQIHSCLCRTSSRFGVPKFETGLLSRRSRQRERLSASELSICLSVSLSVAKMQKKRFSQKLSNLELWCLLTTYQKLCKLNRVFQRTHYWIPIMQDGRDPPSWKRHYVIFFCRGWSDLDKISQPGTEWHVDCGDVWKWKPYSNMADVWANSMACHPTATCHTAGCCHLVNSLSWFQSHMPHCRVQSTDEVNVVILPHCRV